MSNSPKCANANTNSFWVWDILLAISFVVAVFPVSVLVYQILCNRSVWYIVLPDQGWISDSRLEAEMHKDWPMVELSYRPQWLLYRTPISLYLASAMTCASVAACYAARRKWYRDIHFFVLYIIVVTMILFHIWAQNPLTEFRYVKFWPFLLFPASLLIPLWLIVLSVERYQNQSK